MPGAFEVRDVNTWDVVNAEPLGRDAKWWLHEPGASTASRERDWLFKPVVTPQHGHPQGEDWAEKIVSELCPLLGVPCAEVELAERHGVPGSISRNVTPDGWNRVLGSILLGTVVEDYQEGQLNPPGRPGHSPLMIMNALVGCQPPPGCGDLTAAETFAGYLVLDAWVANRDRHDQNWAVVRRAASPGGLQLAPSYDHASGLGFSLFDERRERLLRSDAVGRWAQRGRAHRFEHDPRLPPRDIPTLVAIAHHALDVAGKRARRHWSERLRTLDWDKVEDVVASTPRLSDVTARFILELLVVNRRRLLRDN